MEIFAEATGNPQNPHVVLLAGLCLSGAIYDDVCASQTFLENLYIVRYDVRGHGRSGKPTTPEAYESVRFAQDFKAVADAFGLYKPVLAGWSMGGTAPTDIVSYLPPNTLSGAIYISGVPAVGEILSLIAAPGLAGALSGLLSDASVNAFRLSSQIFVDSLFAKPEEVPFADKAMYLGHSLSPEIMGLTLGRKMDVEKLWEAGEAGLPLLTVQGTEDMHRKGAVKNVDDIVRGRFRNYEAIWLEGRGHALHYECPEEFMRIIVDFTKRVYGKDYAT